MNDINELIEIINNLGGEASLQEIAIRYGYNHHLIMFGEYESAILFTLKNNTSKVHYNSYSKTWSSISEEQKEFLFVKDDKYFKTIRKAMLYIFNKRVPSQGAYFNIDSTHDAWFPQESNSEWNNILSDDGKFWYETPSDKKALSLPNSNLRYTFLKSIKGYKFSGVFRFLQIKDDNCRVYEIVDDKVEIQTIMVTASELEQRENFKKYLEKVLLNNENKGKRSLKEKSSLNSYVSAIKLVSDELIKDGSINESLYLIKDHEYLKSLWQELLHGDTELDKKNQRGNNRLSSAVKFLYLMREEENNSTLVK